MCFFAHLLANQAAAAALAEEARAAQERRAAEELALADGSDLQAALERAWAPLEALAQEAADFNPSDEEERRRVATPMTPRTPTRVFADPSAAGEIVSRIRPCWCARVCLCLFKVRLSNLGYQLRLCAPSAAGLRDVPHRFWKQTLESQDPEYRAVEGIIGQPMVRSNALKPRGDIFQGAPGARS